MHGPKDNSLPSHEELDSGEIILSYDSPRAPLSSLPLLSDELSKK